MSDAPSEWEIACRVAALAATTGNVPVRSSTVLAIGSEIERLRAQLEVAQAASESAVNKAQWQAVTNRELNEAQDEITRLRAALAQSSPQPAPAVPEGWKLVPVEPTPEMVDAMCAEVAPSEWPGAYRPHAQMVWRNAVHAGYVAMFSAAPQEPQR